MKETPSDLSQVVDDLNRGKFDILSQGRELIDLSMINPDLQPSRFLQDRLVQACLKPTAHRYSVSRGLKRLRSAFALKYSNHFGVDLDDEREVCVTMGCKDAMMALLQVLRSTGKRRMLLTRPWYPAHFAVAEVNEFTVGDVPWSSNEDRFCESVKSEVGSGRWDLFVVNFPMNPGGAIISINCLRRIQEICSEFGVLLVNDFTYGEMAFSDEATSFLSNSGEKRGLLEIYSLSKAYSISGWRIAAIMGDCKWIEKIAQFKSVADYGVFIPLQVAAADVLSSEDRLASEASRIYQRRADVLVSELESIGWRANRPQAGASIWAELPSHWQGGSAVVATEFLKWHGVATLPGIMFGDDRFLRFALVRSEEYLRESVFRLAKLERNLQGQSSHG